MNYRSGALYLFIFLSVLSYAQPKRVILVKNNSFVLSINSKQTNFNDLIEGKFTIRDFYDFTDPSKPGSIKLPSENIIIAIPPNSHPDFKVLTKELISYNNIIPALNPQSYLGKDSTIMLRKVDYKNITGNYSSVPVIEVKKYFWFRDFYCVQLKVNNYSFDEQNSRIDEIKILLLK